MEGKPPDASSTIYTRDYLAMLGLGNLTTADLLKTRILPAMTKNMRRMPEAVQHIVSKASGAPPQPAPGVRPA
jgi:hypothetical protein